VNYDLSDLEKSNVIFLNPDDQNSLFEVIIRRSLSGLLIFQGNQIVFSNPALQELFGLSEEEILRSNSFDLVHPIDRDLVRQRVKKRLQGLSPPDDYELRILTSNGRTKWVRLLATSITFQGAPAVMANIIDINDQKLAEEKQREKERLSAAMLNSLPHPALLIRRDRIILAANRHALDLGAKIGGFCSSEFGSRIFGPESLDNVKGKPACKAEAERIKCELCLAGQAFESGKTQSVNSLHAFGKYWDAFWIPVDEETYLHYAIDITEQKKIEQAIRDSEERYQLVSDTMNEGLSIQNNEGVIKQVNRRFCEISGFASHELIGRFLSELIVSKDSENENNEMFLGNQEKLELETFIRHKDGRVISVAMKIDFLVNEGGDHKGSFAFFNDISEMQILRRHAAISDKFENIVGSKHSMRKLFTEIIEVATCDFPVVIQGETGVGKELVAQAIHNQSPRAKGMFVPVNCAALPEALLESELFGHVKGSFTGGFRDKKGRFELAHDGTIFLDEIAELNPATQVKLLRVLQDGAFERVGDNRTIKTNARVISATNKNVVHEMNDGRFRQDLYYRLCVMPIWVPPLRERKSDIPLLVDHFLSAIANKISSEKTLISPDALLLLMAYDWPGNVRELQNAIHLAYIKSKGKVIQPNHLPPLIGFTPTASTTRRKRRSKLNQDDVRDALRQTNGNKMQAATILGVNRTTLYRFLAKRNPNRK